MELCEERLSINKLKSLLLLKKSFGELMLTLDFNSMGGALLLGVKKPVIKAHGSANADTVVNTVKQAMKLVKSK